MLRLRATVTEIKIAAITAMTTASTRYKDIGFTVGADVPVNCIVIWCVLKCVVYHT